jgi:hypothetical protein
MVKETSGLNSKEIEKLFNQNLFQNENDVYYSGDTETKFGLNK